MRLFLIYRYTHSTRTIGAWYHGVEGMGSRLVCIFGSDEGRFGCSVRLSHQDSGSNRSAGTNCNNRHGYCTPTKCDVQSNPSLVMYIGSPPQIILLVEHPPQFFAPTSTLHTYCFAPNLDLLILGTWTKIVRLAIDCLLQSNYILRSLDVAAPRPLSIAHAWPRVQPACQTSTLMFQLRPPDQSSN